MKNISTSLILAFVLSFIGFHACPLLGQTVNRVGGEINQTGSGICWLTNNNVSISDDQYAYATPVLLGGVTQKIQISHFGFEIPLDATIKGIEVTIEKGSSLLSSVVDKDIKLMKNGTPIGSDMSEPGFWPNTDWPSYYGGYDSYWGTTWTPEEINNENFGISIQAELAAQGLPEAVIDIVKITVHYEAPQWGNQGGNTPGGEAAISVFRDDAAGQLHAVFTGEFTSPVFWAVFSFDGEPIVNETFDPNSPTEINTNGWDPGLYVSHIQCGALHYTRLIPVP